MAMTKEELQRNPELQALTEIEGVDGDNILEQAGLKEPEPGQKPNEGSGDTPPPPNKPPEGGTTPPAGTTTPEEPPRKPDENELLKEIFGDRFKSIDEAKEKVPDLFTQIENLRKEKEELEQKLGKKPKTDFADDEVALYNEFVKKTGVKSYSVFQKIANSDVEQMDDLDALVLDYLLKNPAQIGNEARVRAHFQRKYNINPDEVDEEELEINKIGLSEKGVEVKKGLKSIKEELKVPEPVEEEPPQTISPEKQKELEQGWEKVGKAISQNFGKIPVPIKDGKSPLLEFELSETEQQEITKFVKQYATQNQMELKSDNVDVVAKLIYNMVVVNNLPKIVHSVFEKARSMTTEEMSKLYENPSPQRNNDQPPAVGTTPATEEEKIQEEIFNAEMERYS